MEMDKKHLRHGCNDVQKNEFICIMGISGCGKTTLLNAIAGFIEPNHGEILLKGNKIMLNLH